MSQRKGKRNEEGGNREGEERVMTAEQELAEGKRKESRKARGEGGGRKKGREQERRQS